MLAPHIVQLQDVIEKADEFDIIHFHTDYLHFPFTNHLRVAHATTLHGKLTIPELQPLYDKFSQQPVISISNNQRSPLRQANWIGTVHHGLPIELHKPGDGGGNYLAFLGRVSPEKGLDKAITIAKAAGIPLKVAAKIDSADTEYFESYIKQQLDHPLIEFIGEINEEQKSDFLGNALALLFPINWDEPFGMVMIEAMACGTPVIAFERGSVPEIIENGQNGFIVHSEKEAVNAVHQLNTVDRKKIRTIFEERFTSRRMADDYLQLYQSLIQKKKVDDRLFTISNSKLSVV
jgi:glycosyltransferase involved in cell wall biosynthesis